MITTVIVAATWVVACVALCWANHRARKAQPADPITYVVLWRPEEPAHPLDLAGDELAERFFEVVGDLMAGCDDFPLWIDGVRYRTCDCHFMQPFAPVEDGAA